MAAAGQRSAPASVPAAGSSDPPEEGLETEEIVGEPSKEESTVEALTAVAAFRTRGAGGSGEVSAVAGARGAGRTTRRAGQIGTPQESRRGTSW